jgi:hypothetical protein
VAQHCFFGQWYRVQEGLHSLAEAVLSALRSLFVVVLYPQVQIGLKLLQCFVNLLSERDLIKLLKHGLVESLTDAVCLRASRFRFGVVDIFDCQIELVLVVLTAAG